MALTFSNVAPLDSVGNRRLTVTDITIDASYAAGGIPLTPSQLGLSQVAYGDVAVKTITATGPSSGFLDCSSPLAPKLKLQNAASAAELANGAASGAILEVTAIGFP